MIEPIIFENEGQKLVGILHQPEDEISKPRPAVILCHGFTGQKSEPHRIFVKMARKLADNGVFALRFDFRGSGDSEGDFKDVTLETEISDLFKAIEILKSRSEIDNEQLSLLGLSFGGAVASCVAGRSSEIKNLMLWSAVGKLEDVFLDSRDNKDQQLVSLQQQGFIDYKGNKIGRSFVRQLSEVDPLEEIKEYQGDLLVIHGGEDEAVPIENAYNYYEETNIDEIRKKLIIIKGADHTYNQVRWEQKVLDSTLKWIKKRVNG